MAPPKIGKLIPIRLPDDMINKIDARCAKTGLSRAETVRKMLTWALEQPTR